MATFEESVKYFHKKHMTITTEDDQYVNFYTKDDQYVNFYTGNNWYKFYVDLYSQTIEGDGRFHIDPVYHALNILMECKCDDVSQTCANIISKVNAVVPGLAKKEEDA